MRIDFLEPKGPQEEADHSSATQKLLWFIGISAVSGIAVACVAYALRATLFL